MRFESAGRPRRRVSLTPLIDVVFLLLIFFMLATHFGSERFLPLRVRPDAAESASTPVRQDEIRILVSAEGRAQLDGVELSPEELPRALARALAVDPNRPVRVLPVPDSSLQAIVTLLAELERADVTEVVLQLASQPPRVE